MALFWNKTRFNFEIASQEPSAFWVWKLLVVFDGRALVHACITMAVKTYNTQSRKTLDCNWNIYNYREFQKYVVAAADLFENLQWTRKAKESARQKHDETETNASGYEDLDTLGVKPNPFKHRAALAWKNRRRSRNHQKTSWRTPWKRTTTFARAWRKRRPICITMRTLPLPSIMYNENYTLELYHKLCISGNKIRWKLQLVGFSCDKKSANVVMWKDKEYEYISRTWNKQNKELTILRLRLSAEKNVEQSFTVWEQTP